MRYSLLDKWWIRALLITLTCALYVAVGIAIHRVLSREPMEVAAVWWAMLLVFMGGVFILSYPILNRARGAEERRRPELIAVGVGFVVAPLTWMFVPGPMRWFWVAGGYAISMVGLIQYGLASRATRRQGR